MNRNDDTPGAAPGAARAKAEKQYRYRVDVAFLARDDVEAREMIESFQVAVEEVAMFYPDAAVTSVLHEVFAAQPPRPVKLL